LEGAETIFRFGVLQLRVELLRVEQLRVDRVKILHPRVIASELHYFNMLQDSVRALFILQARALLAGVL
jgi:hypothetical protein